MSRPDRLPPLPSDCVVVVGAGIVGLSCALALQRDGNEVVVVDHRQPGHGASFGHAGGIAVTWVSPQGLPGLAKRLPRWLLDPLGPVAVRWPYLPRLIPWFLKLQRHSRPSEVGRIADALADLMGMVWPAWERTLGDIGGGLAGLIRHEGALIAYPDRSRIDADQLVWDLRRQRGFAVEVLDAQGVRDLEPALSPDYSAGVWEPQAKWCEDPMAIVESMVARLLERGGVVLQAEVVGFDIEGRHVQGVRTPFGTIAAREVVVAAGAWSHRLAKQFGHRVPLESERGYHLDLPDPGVNLARILSLAPHKLVATPMRSWLRLSGTAEFAGVDTPANLRRADVLFDHALRALPGLSAKGASRWSGDRPIVPDSLPVIGRDPAVDNVHHAFGHSHIGFTLGPATGELIAASLAGRAPALSLGAFSIGRFSRRTS